MRKPQAQFAIVLVLAGGLATAALSLDWAGLVKEAQARYAKFKSELKDMTIQQVMENVSDQGKISSQMTMYVKGDRFRAEVQTSLGSNAPAGMGSIQTIVIGDGKDYWLISPMVGTQKLPSEEAEKYESGWEWWDRLTDDARVVGEEKVSGRACYVVEGKPKEGRPFSKLWIDKEDFLLVKAEGAAQGAEQRVSILSSDFRPVHKDFRIPYRTDVFLGGTLASTTQVTSVKINTGLADDLFDAKKAKAKGPSMEEMMKMLQRQQP